MKVSIRLLLTLIIFAAGVVSATAQYLAAKPAPAGQETESPNAIEEQAYLLLEDVVANTHTLKLPQNRSRLQIIAADLLWKRDQSRARSLFSDAAANVVEMEKQTRGSVDQVYDHPSSAQLRQELVLTAARHDAALAYELLQRTRPKKAGAPDGRVPEDETYLEQRLLTQTMATEQHSPARAQAVRQKIGELDDKTRPGMGQLTYLSPQSTSNSLLTAAASAPSEMRDRLYQQAAIKAVDEGSVERARQIANDHLSTNMRKPVLQRIAAQQQLRNDKSVQLEELRQKLEVISDQERVSLLLQLVEATKTDNPKQSLQFLDEALGLVTRPATSYKQFEDQLQVAHVLGAIEPHRSLDLLESGINKLNELLSAAAALSGFEVQIFKPGEMPLPGNSKLGEVVIRYGQELAILAKSDFGRASAAAEQFQYLEARLFTRLSIVQAVLGKE